MIGASLIAIGAVWGLIAWWIFRRVLNHAAMKKTGKRIYARLLEIRLYSEEPSLVWKAQRALVIENFRFLLIMAPPVLILAVSFALLYGPLDSIYGYAPIQAGHSAIVTTPFHPGVSYTLTAPPGIAVETPPVRDFADAQVSWRVRATSPVTGILNVTTPGGTASRTIAAGERTFMRYSVRESNPWIEVDYPRADVTIAGWQLPWLVWFFGISSFTAASIMFLTKSPGRSTGRPIPRS